MKLYIKNIIYDLSLTSSYIVKAKCRLRIERVTSHMYASYVDSNNDVYTHTSPSYHHHISLIISCPRVGQNSHSNLEKLTNGHDTMR